MKVELLAKYNVPVPRYTSYPPANYFVDSFTGQDYLEAVELSNHQQPEHISVYIHIPFCRQRCYYCGCNSMGAGSSERVKQYLEAVGKEMDMVLSRLSPDRRISQIHYGGGTPTMLDVEVLHDFNQRILSRFPSIENPEIAIECHPAYPNQKYWLDLTRAGFTRFSLGVQDLNKEVLDAVNRRAPVIPMEAIVDMLREQGASINMDFIYGLPLQTAESFARTIRRAVSYRPDRIVTFSYAHVPWVNPLQKKLEEAGLPSQEEKSRMYEAAVAVLKAAGYHAVGMDHFVLEGDELNTALREKTLHRNFQGYCTRRTTGQVYAFGVSGISQLATAYMQNTKNLRTYINSINQGILPVERGYRLNRDEQITREVITALMCNYGIRWDELAERLSLTPDEVRGATAYRQEAFDEFAADGLIRFVPGGFEMTEEGTLFVRNVAASLDRLMLSGPKSFSKPV